MEVIRNGLTETVLAPLFADKVRSLSLVSPSGEANYVFRDEIINPATLGEASPIRYIALTDWTVYSHNGTEWEATAGSEGSVTIPHSLLKVCGTLNVTWTYTESGELLEEHEEVKIYQPLFTDAELIKFDPDFANVSPPALKSLERLVRAVVEAYTEQKFELTYETLIGRSHKSDSIVLPKRMVSTTKTVNGIPAQLESDGWILRARGAGNTDYLTDKFYVNHTWSGNIRVTGYFGYQSVPSNVSLAAMMLAQEYGCEESAWRDKYVANLKNSDWRVEFNDQTWAGTGNVKVDQILAKYKRFEMAVI